MGLLLDKEYKTGDPIAGVPHTFFGSVDEILTNLGVYNGHIERNGNFWQIVYDKGEDPDQSGVGPHRFRGTASATTGAVDIDTGGWNLNGTMIVDTGGTSGLGDTANPYIIATITKGTSKPLAPSTITLTAAAAPAADSEFTSKRNIGKINHDTTSGNYSSFSRYQIGDIYEKSNGINVVGPVWDDGGVTGRTFDVLTAIQFDTTSHKFQYKAREFELRDGSFYVNLQDTGWTDVFTATACP